MKYFNLRLIFSVLFFLTAGGCSQKGGGSSGQSSTTPPSPFDEQKVIASGSLQSKIAAANGLSLASSGVIPASAVIPASVKFDFVVDDICLATRLKNANRKIKYMIDAYAKTANLVQDPALLHESVISVLPKQQLTFGKLQTLAKADPCIVGVTDTQNARVQGSAAAASGITFQDYQRALGFDQADAFLKANVDPKIKVRVAVIDSGLDLAALTSSAVSPDLQGTDYVGQDDLPQDTLGHGTQVASVLNAAPGNPTGIVGMGYQNVEVLPIRLFGDQPSAFVEYGTIFDAVKRSVNMGAEVVNMSFSGVIDRPYSVKETPEQKHELDKGLECSVIVGHALQRAILRHTFFTMAAGHATSYRKFKADNICHEPSLEGAYMKFRTDGNGKFVMANGEPVPCGCASSPDDKSCALFPVPGPVYSRKDNGPLFFGNTALPACWAHYFKGAVAVAALEQNNALVDRPDWGTNWGTDGIELAAPGAGIPTIGLSKKMIIADGTSFASPMAAVGAAMIMAVHKQMQLNASAAGGNPAEWAYTPWLVEDILINGSRRLASLNATANHPAGSYDDYLVYGRDMYQAIGRSGFTKSTIPEGAFAVRNGSMLHFGDLSAYLSALKGQAFADRRRQATDNAELGYGFDPTLSTSPAATLVGMQAYVENTFERNRNRFQLQAVAYFSNGSTKVITPSANWTADSKKVSLDAQGVAYPDLDFTGAVKFTASYQGQTASTTAYVTEVDVVSGDDDMIPDSIEIVPQPIFRGDSFSMRAFATYPNRGKREITKLASWSADQGYSLSGQSLQTGSQLDGSMGFQRRGDTLPDTPVVITAFFYGRKAQFSFRAPRYVYKGDSQIVDVVNFQAGLWTDLPPSKRALGPSSSFTAKEGYNLDLKITPDCTVDYSNTGVSSSLWGPSNGNWCGLGLQNSYIPFKESIVLSGRLGPFYWTGEMSRFVDVRAEVALQPNPIVSLTFNLQPNHPHISGSGNQFTMSRWYGDILIPYATYADGTVKPVLDASRELDISWNSPDGTPLLRSHGIKQIGGPQIALTSFELSRNYNSTFTATLKANPTVQARASIYVDGGGEATPLVNDLGASFLSRALFQRGYALNSYTTVFENSVVNSKPAASGCAGAASQGAAFPAGSGRADSPYVICNPQQLLAAMTSGSYGSSYFILQNHIDMAGLPQSEIPVQGVKSLDGNGYEIRNYGWISADTKFPGLVSADEVKNLGFRAMHVTAAPGSEALVKFATTLTSTYCDDSTLQGASAVGNVRTVNGLYITNSKFLDAPPIQYINGRIEHVFANVNVQQQDLGLNYVSGGLTGILYSSGCASALKVAGGSIAGCAYLKDAVVISTVRSVARNFAGGLASAVLTTNGQPFFMLDVAIYTDINAVGDAVGGVVGGAIGSESDMENNIGSGLYLQNVQVHGTVRGRDRVGSFAGAAGAIWAFNNSSDATLMGSEYVGAGLGTTGGYGVYVSNDVSRTVVSAVGLYKGGFIAAERVAMNRGDLLPANRYFAPYIYQGNIVNGGMFSTQQMQHADYPLIQGAAATP